MLLREIDDANSNNNACAKNCKLVRRNASKNFRKCSKPIAAKGERMDNYAIKGLYEVFYDLAGEIFKKEIRSLSLSEREKLLFKSFNISFQKCCDNYIFSKEEYRNGNIVTLDSTLFDGLYLSSEDTDLAWELLGNFNKYYKKIVKTFSKNSKAKKVFLNNSIVNNYLDAYLELCRFVFKPNCFCQEELRTLKIIEKILNIDYNKSRKCFGLYSPFVVFSVLRTLKYIAALPDDIDHNDLPEDCTQLNSRKHILATYAIRSLSRFTIIDGKSCVVEYSRRNDSIICKDVQNVSSIDNVKPIRLFEKITSYIYNYFENAPYGETKDFIISVYGFCWFEDRGKKNPVEIDDLVYEIFSWFEDKRKYDDVLMDKMIGKLVINYYLISDDVEKEIPFVYDYYEDKIENERNSGETYHCNFKININKFEKYNNKHLAKVINESDIIFVLDCPWLATENYNLDTEGDLDSYGQWVQQVSYRRDLESLYTPQPQNTSFFDRVHLFASINDQFSRLAVMNNNLRYGKVVRVMKDYLLNWIQQEIDSYKKDNIYKSIYIYNSSLRGMSYSNYALYPIVREESYSNKRFTIMKFSTRENKGIPIKIDNKIYISLWSLLKYVDISFAFVGIKNWFTQNFYHMIKEVDDEEQKKQIINRDIISILRNIVFVVDYSKAPYKQIQQVNIKIVLSNPVRQKYYSEANDRIKKLISFFEKILTDIIFQNSTGLGDCCIRDAFERCLYNQSKSVNDLFFLHLYSFKKESQSLSYFKVEFNSDNLAEENSDVDNLVPNFDSFSDKRAYQKLFDYLDILNSPEYAVRSLLNQVDKNFKDETFYMSFKDHSTEILYNIKQTCERNGYTSSHLYKNVLRFIK